MTIILSSNTTILVMHKESQVIAFFLQMAYLCSVDALLLPQTT
jgi:hypothetical protein